MAMETVTHKTFTYETFSEWVGAKAATFSSVGKPTFRVASPPEFRGEKNVWTPEDPLTELGTPVEIVRFFGGKENYLAAIRELESEIYNEVA